MNAVNATYHRYRDALSQIAKGASNPQHIAREALSDRRPVGKPKIKPPGYKSMEQRSREARDNALRTFEQWCAAGKPTIKKFAQIIGGSPTRVGAKVSWGARMISSRKKHPLYIDAIKRRYREDWEWYANEVGQ